MRIQHGDLQFELPGDLRVKLARFRRRVWMIKTAEATLIVVTLGLLSYIAVFALDRFGETPAWLRGLLLFGVAGAAMCWLPWQLNRWVWRNRSLSQLARLLSRDQPHVGDRLLGVIELVRADPINMRHRRSAGRRSNRWPTTHATWIFNARCRIPAPPAGRRGLCHDAYRRLGPVHPWGRSEYVPPLASPMGCCAALHVHAIG